MQAEDNGYYLKLDENGEYAVWGCCYAHCVSVSLSELSDDTCGELAAYDLYPWEYTSFPVDGDVILIEDDRLADALTVLPQGLRDIFLLRLQILSQLTSRNEKFHHLCD